MALRKEPNFHYLLAGIVAFLLLGPTVENFLGNRLDGIVLMTAYTGMLVLSLWGLQDTRWIFVSGTALAILSVVMIATDVLIPDIDLALVSLTLYLLFQLLTIWLASSYLFTGSSVSMNKIVGGTCVYFLIGMTWAIFYVFLIAFDTDAFQGSNLGPEGQIYWDLTYFSFVTITTLGFGDILPVSPTAKALAYTEAVVGQIYVAVFIGAMVATYIGHRVNKDLSAGKS